MILFLTPHGEIQSESACSVFGWITTYVFCNRWLDTLFAQIDANFRLKNKDRSLKDESLNGGTASIVKEEPYKEHLASRGEQTEVHYLSSLSSAASLTPTSDQYLRLGPPRS